MIKTFSKILLLLLLTSCSANSKPAESSERSETADTESIEVMTFDADSCFAKLKAQVDFGPRVPGSEAHKNTARFIQDELAKYGANTILQNTSAVTAQGKTIPVYNILGQYNPDCKKRILLLAHWDTRPWADEESNEELHSKPIDGANDGASGVAVLLELARLMNVKSPENTGVDLLFVDAEDSGDSGDDKSWCLGTQLWVKNMPYTSENKPQYAILLDMVGGRNAKFHREYFSDKYARSIVNKVWSIASVSGYGSRFVNEAGGGITDDHLVINEVGIPAIDIIENNNAQTGSFNPTWHTLEDNIKNIDKSTLKAVGQVMSNYIYNKNI